MSAPESVTITLPAAPCSAISFGWSNVIASLRKTNYVTAHDIADQIEAQLPKPKPEEPKGLGAVVLDRTGMRWVRFTTFADGCHWAADGSATNATYREIDVVEVLSEGVTA